MCIFIGHSYDFSSWCPLKGIPDHAPHRPAHLSLKSYRSVSSFASRPCRTISPVMKPVGQCIARCSTGKSDSKLRPSKPVHSARAVVATSANISATWRGAVADELAIVA